MAPKETYPLPLSDLLSDLAILRASDVDLSTILSEKPEDARTDSQLGEGEREQTVMQSYEFVREARAAIRILHRGDVDMEGDRVDAVRSGLAELLQGVEPVDRTDAH